MPADFRISSPGESNVISFIAYTTFDIPAIEVVYQHEVEAEKMYKDFFAAKVSKIPEVTLKVSVSLDGKQATDSGQSQWITNPGVKQYRIMACTIFQNVLLYTWISNPLTLTRICRLLTIQTHTYL